MVCMILYVMIYIASDKIREYVHSATVMVLELSSLSLYVATPEQLVESRRRTCKQWARGLTEEDYIQNHFDMDKYDNARDGKLITW